MRKVLAGAMMCLLLLLSIGTLRCEAQCAVSPISMTGLSAPNTGPQMDAGMDHCKGMVSEQGSMPVADTVCAVPMCHHQVLPSTADSKLDGSAQPDRAVVILPVIVLARNAVNCFARTPRPQRSPLEQSSTLRV